AVLLAGHKALAVVERRRHEVGGPVGFTDQSGRCVADEDVHLARLEGRLASGGREGHELHGVGVAQNGGGDGAAEVHVKAGPVAVRIYVAEAEQRVVGAADEPAALPHPVQGLRAADGRHNQKQNENEHYHYSEPFPHFTTPRKVLVTRMQLLFSVHCKSPSSILADGGRARSGRGSHAGCNPRPCAFWQWATV